MINSEISAQYNILGLEQVNFASRLSSINQNRDCYKNHPPQTKSAYISVFMSHLFIASFLRVAYSTEYCSSPSTRYSVSLSTAKFFWFW